MTMVGRYEILDELGHGAMGAVYRAHDPKIDRIVAIKIIRVAGLGAGGEEEYRERFLREARAAGRLSHHGIVTIYDVEEEQATEAPYIVMEYVAGRTLENLLTEAPGERLPLETTLELIKQIAEALHYAHCQGIVHRDIKPHNILITTEGRAKIADFGVAKITATQYTVVGEVLGTPSYMSPEQLSGNAVDGRSDLFSLGVILYWMLTGEKPFTGENPTTVSFKIAYQEAVVPTQLNPLLGPDVDYLIGRALAKDPALRYQTGRELADDLEDLRQAKAPRSRSTFAIPDVTLEKTVVRGAFATLPPKVPAGRFRLVGGRMVDFAKHLSRKTYIAFAIGFILLCIVAFGPWKASRSISLPVKTSALHMNCRHSFRVAEISVWIDGGPAYTGKLAGTVERRLGLFKTVRGSLSETIRVPVGIHVVRVRVSSPGEGYGQTKQVKGEFVKEREKFLEISFEGKSRDLSLALH
jgi:serine/threonine protein kinase